MSIFFWPESIVLQWVPAFSLSDNFVRSSDFASMLALAAQRCKRACKRAQATRKRNFAVGGDRMAKGDRTSVAKRAACLVAYADTGSIEAAARAAGINSQTARGIVDNNVDVLAETKKAAEERMREFMDSKLDKAQTVIDMMLDAMPDKIERANLLQLATSMGIVIDKFGGQKDFNGNAVQVNVTFGNKAGDMDAFK